MWINILIVILIFALAGTLLMFTIDPFPNWSLLVTFASFMLLAVFDAYFSSKINDQYLCLEFLFSMFLILLLTVAGKGNILCALGSVASFFIFGYIGNLFVKLMLWISPKLVVVVSILFIVLVISTINGLDKNNN